MENEKADRLIKKYLKGDATPEEEALLESWYIKMAEEQPELPTEVNYDEVGGEILDRLRGLQVRPVKKLWPRITAAASVLLLITLGYFLTRQHTSPRLAQNLSIEKKIFPGGNRAVLTLANGQKINLTAARNGKLAIENNATINKTANGQITYTSNRSEKNTIITYNTMSTPRGGLYALTLADGTKVMLNAASSIRYPTVFSGRERRVELTGEAYFEVAHNKAMPFHVITPMQDVKVLGTHFNINSYTNEPGTKTTLLEGSVLINGKTILKPGQQAMVSGSSLKVYSTNTEIAVAWKNNKFMFDNENIQDIMRMIARWYSVEIVYTGDVPDQKFGGSVSRFDDISKVLGILELTGNIHFKIEGRKIIVSK